ncbi:YeeE/YedE thiosulfate transporter family protein [Erythrobacter oryzae]|uniref:YeeE/YedE thiosulfate transporter family protein n=1 Tax=Erythrobacter oryzae TaxID=3019556 RepID=UPI0025575995|nr:YeeE/YedE thiosulfate transporter family protein [Erythrobacter sp. COR-2]
MILVLTTALMFLIGYASQRAGVCMVRAMREVIEKRRVHRLAGFALAAAAAMVVMGLAEWLGAAPFMTLQGSAPDGLSVAGGVLFGLGSVLAGNCAMGLLSGLTQGELWRAGSIAAMFVAALLLGPEMSSAALMLSARAPVPSPLTGHVGLALTLGGTVGALAATYIYRRLGWKRPKGGWSPLIAMGVIGTASGLLFAADRQWVYTSRIAEIAYGISWAPGALLGLAALLAGMTGATIIGRTFAWRAGSGKQWLRAVAGGLLMGAGATLVPGGNDAMLFTGVPLLLPNLLAGYASFAATLALALLIRRQAVPPGA